MFESLRHFVTEHEKVLSWVAFLTGFTWDNLTLTQIDLLFDNIILIGLLAIATLGIILLNLHEEKKETSTRLYLIAPFIPLMVQFALGGLFSALFVFYSRSGTLLSAWPFLLLLVALLVGNEFFRRRYLALTFQLTIYYIALLSLTILLVPVFVNKMGAWIFVISSVLSVVLMVLLMKLLKYVAPIRLTRSWYSSLLSIAVIFLAFQGLYFTNVIPPIPLSAKHIGLYHKVDRTPDGYIVTYEEGYWWEFWKSADRVFHKVANEPLYCFASIFAPAKLNTKILHHWQYKGEDGWEDRGRVTYSIVGGRSEGYRGYTVKSNAEDGVWRCQVRTERGQVIGQETLRVVSIREAPTLVTELR